MTDISIHHITKTEIKTTEWTRKDGSQYLCREIVITDDRGHETRIAMYANENRTTPIADQQEILSLPPRMIERHKASC